MAELSKLTVVSACLFLICSGAGCVAFLPFVESDYDNCSVDPAGYPSSCEAHALRKMDNGYSQPQAQRRGYQTKAQVEQKKREQRMQRLIVQLKSKDPAARTNAATDLGSLGPFARPAVEPLAYALMYDDCKWVRRASAKALPKISSDPAVVRALAKALHDRNEWVAHSAAGSLRKIGTREAMTALRSKTARSS